MDYQIIDCFVKLNRKFKTIVYVNRYDENKEIHFTTPEQFLEYFKAYFSEQYEEVRCAIEVDR